MGKPLHPVYEKFLFDCYEIIQEALGTGKIKSEEELEAYILDVCSPLNATDGFSFICQYASYSWKDIVSIELLEECKLDLVEFIKQTFRMMLGFEVFLNVKMNSDGYRFLMEGGQSTTTTLLPGSIPIEFMEYWKCEADQYKDCKVIESVVADDGHLTIYQLPDGFESVFVMNHLDSSLCWIGKPVVN